MTISEEVIRIESLVESDMELARRIEDMRKNLMKRGKQKYPITVLKLLGYERAEVGRYLGVTSSCVTRVASREDRLEDLQVRYKIR
jgi:hypothetical protein